MSVTKQTTLWCDAHHPDGDPCEVWYMGDTGDARVARSMAKDLGWTSRGGEDRCPTHSGSPREAEA